jgi:D-amino-acid dehydrogenase
VFERHAAVASGTSFANAGVIAPGYVTPWAAPGMPWKVMRHVFGRHAPVRFGGLNVLGHAPWIWQWLRACGPAVYQTNRAQMFRLASFSSQRMQAMTEELKLEFEQARGLVVLLRSARDLAQAQGTLRLLTELQVVHELLDATQCRALEPGLNADMPLQAGISLPHDGVGNCRQFAHLLKAQAHKLGARFRFQHDVQVLRSGPRPRVVARSLATPGAAIEEEFDAVVVCAGHQANTLLQPLGCKLPIVPVYGYSLTAPLRHSDAHHQAGPRGAVMDEKYKVAISRLGQRIRVAGSAELGGTAVNMNDAALATLYKVLDDWFPGAAQMSQAVRWKGARPMLPDGPPMLGASAAAGVWLNLGHGSSGWALSCGSARIVADLVGGREPALDISGLSPQRLLRR